MKFITLVLLTLFIGNWAFAQEQSNFVENQLIVKYKTDIILPLNEKSSSFTQLDSLNYNYGVNSIELVGKRELRSTYVLTFNESQNIPVLVKEYMQMGLFN